MNGDCVHYLPHHAVIRRDRETTKLRIVYDGSAKPPDRDYSLNGCLETGPNFTPQLFDMLIRFRWYKIGLTADIEKAFPMVAINNENRDMLRFLWLKEPTKPNSEIQQLRFTRLVFGLRPSPAILGSTICHYLDTQTDSNPQQVELLKNSLYCKLDHVAHSSPAVNPVSEEDESYAKTVTDPSANAKKDNTVKVLGLIWNTTSDQLEFNLTSPILPIKFARFLQQRGPC